MISLQLRDTTHTIQLSETIQNKLQESSNPSQSLSTWIQNGSIVSQCIPGPVQSCGCCQQFKSIATSMTDLLEPFQTGGNSSKNGRIGEIFATTAFQKIYPGIHYEDTAHIEKSGDGLLSLPNHRVSKIILDYKNYDSPVPKQEIHKLVRDLKAQNVSYGILISYKSRISGKRSIDYDMIDGKLIVYISECGFNSLIFELAIQYLLKLDECELLSNQTAVSDLVRQSTIQTQTDLYERLLDLSKQMTRSINQMKECQDKMNGMFYSMIDRQMGITHTMNLLLELAESNIQQYHKESPCQTNTYEELSMYIQTKLYREKDKKYALRILTMLKQHDLCGFYSQKDNSIHVYRDSIEIGKLYFTKTKVQMIFAIHSSQCSLHVEYEEYKQKQIYITLQDNPEVWKILETRLLDKNNI